ncbi:hypothetical protein AYO20_06005 [Fonsecaea nubica]|uniref:Uncharacterized protein n=1 Tax=Fonsecaea nubica TaxID=856822 RepID=A0A178CY76_9EURO|nr:hypothetical protein AYO20_06005 [Fonsecaea nubica]OAL34810.1 hypothetical protein AYO20_06005 [Fonsecaea nubica]
MLELIFSRFISIFASILSLQVLTSTAMPFPVTNITDVGSNGCVWDFSPTANVRWQICGENVSYQQLVYPTTTGCMALATGMKNVWTNECSSWIGEHYQITVVFLSLSGANHGDVRRSMYHVDAARLYRRMVVEN